MLGLCLNFEFELFICVRILLTKCRLILLIILCLYETYICLFISIVFPRKWVISIPETSDYSMLIINKDEYFRGFIGFYVYYYFYKVI